MKKNDAESLCRVYRDGLLGDTIPFWIRHAIDRDNGGYFFCLDRDGSLMSPDKSVWLTARFIWTLSTLYTDVEQRQEWLDLAAHGVEFLRRYLMHVLPRGFHKVRYYGLWHHSRRKQACRAWLLLTLAKPPSDNGRTTITELIEALSRLADEALAPMTGDSDISESRAATPRCPHCDSVSTVLVAEVARQGRR